MNEEIKVTEFEQLDDVVQEKPVIIQPTIVPPRVPVSYTHLTLPTNREV